MLEWLVRKSGGLRGLVQIEHGDGEQARCCLRIHMAESEEALGHPGSCQHYPWSRTSGICYCSSFEVPLPSSGCYRVGTRFSAWAVQVRGQLRLNALWPGSLPPRHPVLGAHPGAL